MYKLEWGGSPSSPTLEARSSVRHQPPLALSAQVREEEGGYTFSVQTVDLTFFSPRGWLDPQRRVVYATVEEAKADAEKRVQEVIPMLVERSRAILAYELPWFLESLAFKGLLAGFKQNAACMVQLETLLTNSNSEGK